MDLFQMDDNARLFISPAIESWEALARYEIDTVIDLEGGLDTCIPTNSNHCLYIYFPIDDDNEKLPNMCKLRAIARLGASPTARTSRAVARDGLQQSALVDGVIRTSVPGVKESRAPGGAVNALFSNRFAACSHPSARPPLAS
jgi:hypothetical protein